MTASIRNKDFLFGVVYDDESFGPEATTTKSLVKFLVTEVERQLKALNSEDIQWRGYYTARDGLPGENKMKRYACLAHKCQYIICVVTRNFVTKGLPGFYLELTQYLQLQKGASRLIPVYYGMTEDEAYTVKSHEGQLPTLMLSESLIIPEQYQSDSSEWISRIVKSLLS